MGAGCSTFPHSGTLRRLCSPLSPFVQLESRNTPPRPPPRDVEIKGDDECGSALQPVELSSADIYNTRETVTMNLPSLEALWLSQHP